MLGSLSVRNLFGLRARVTPQPTHRPMCRASLGIASSMLQHAARRPPAPGFVIAGCVIAGDAVCSSDAVIAQHRPGVRAAQPCTALSHEPAGSATALGPARAPASPPLEQPTGAALAHEVQPVGRGAPRTWGVAQPLQRQLPVWPLAKRAQQMPVAVAPWQSHEQGVGQIALQVPGLCQPCSGTIPTVYRRKPFCA